MDAAAESTINSNRFSFSLGMENKQANEERDRPNPSNYKYSETKFSGTNRDREKIFMMSYR